MESWIGRDAALALLGVKPQTLYAYVSRRLIRMTTAPNDARRSLYSAEDIAQLTGRKMRGRKPTNIAASSMNWGEPAIATGLSTVINGALYYRGQNAIGLAHTATLEDIAALLWGSPGTVTCKSPQHRVPDGFAALAAMISSAQPMLGRGVEILARDAQAIVGTIASACGAASGSDPLHIRLARGWDCHPAATDKIRQALVVMADHDLNASTFAVRVAASTGASLAAAVLAGMCTLSGPRHGGAARALADLLEETRKDGTEAALGRWLDRGGALPGFGHPLYPGGDPRAALMLESIATDAHLEALKEAVLVQTGLLPNCDFGLAAMMATFGLPRDAPFRIFLLGRSIGWCAQAMEQNQSGQLIRPRGRYDGPMPELRCQST